MVRGFRGTLYILIGFLVYASAGAGLHCSKIARKHPLDYSLQALSNDIQVYVNHKVLNSKFDEWPATLKFTKLPEQKKLLVLVSKHFPESDSAIRLFLERSDYAYNELEFFAYNVFEIIIP